MLENHMVVESSANHFDSLSSERDETCIVCKATACLIPDGWYPDCHIAEDDGVPYLEGEGKEFMDAADTPRGWACSKACRSQAMYNAASDAEKKVLRMVRDACRVINDHGKNALDIVEKGMDDYSLTANLTDGSDEFFEAIDHMDGCPEWCGQESGEDA